jgi:hypothetical protein
MKRTIVAISVNTSPKRFIQSTYNRFDNTIGVELTEDPGQARDFQTLSYGKEVAAKIFNPYDRKYTAEKMQVNSSVNQTNRRTEIMTSTRKTVIRLLFSGGYLIKWRSHGGTICYRLYNAVGSPVLNVRLSTIDKLDDRLTVPDKKKLWKIDKNGRRSFNLSVIRQLHGKSYLKSEYKNWIEI